MPHHQNTQNNIGKIDKYCTNCGMNNHNVETCRKKKEHTIMVARKATQHNKKPPKTSSYACHISGLNGHKMTDYPKFTEMQKMFHGKFMTIGEVQPIVEIKPITPYVNVVDVNVTTKSKAIEEHVSKDKKPRKAKNVANWEKKKWLKKSMVEIVQHIQKT
jgi:hypothetical protein